ncbi:hypothetical protein COV20_02805 [Candidatus Woesearchaeota archaeon CG10_big_fil_rev_8_21_14_0_10_45_16]|nr:MAG: hypothetical protein COV20_02805 [Candidatus Woesearchaeota archaeon CG10_big_fil_rev_8_21_14_0_10_45_16]
MEYVRRFIEADIDVLTFVAADNPTIGVVSVACPTKVSPADLTDVVSQMSAAGYQALAFNFAGYTPDVSAQLVHAAALAHASYGIERAGFVGRASRDFMRTWKKLNEQNQVSFNTPPIYSSLDKAVEALMPKK